MKEKFAIIDDPRHPGYIEHKLTDILVIVMCAVMCRMDTLSDIMEYAESKAEFLREKFGIEKIPSKPTMSRVLSMIDGKAVADVMIEIMRENIGISGEIIAVDGKAICSTNKQGKSNRTLQILTAYVTENGVVLGQKAIKEKTNEIPEFQSMIETLNVEGKTITADAMHCQKETCKKIIQKKGNYVFGLKMNQQRLYEDVKLFLDEKINEDEIEIAETLEKGRGRIEKRVCRKTNAIEWIDKSGWRGLKSIFSITRQVETPKGKSEETNYYITSLDISAARLMEIAREHWKIESMHWMLDVVFSEDQCVLYTENAHVTMNAFRKLALALHKQYIEKKGSPKKKTIKGNMISCLANDRILLDVISNL